MTPPQKIKKEKKKLESEYQDMVEGPSVWQNPRYSRGHDHRNVKTSNRTIRA